MFLAWTQTTAPTLCRPAVTSASRSLRARPPLPTQLAASRVSPSAAVTSMFLTPVFLLSGITSILGVLSTRLARVADRVDALAEKLETAGPAERNRLHFRLAYLRRRSHILDVAVMMATLSGAATSIAALLLFVGTLRDRTGISLFVAFGLALVFTVGALGAFLIEMLLASHGIRDLAAKADEIDESAEPLHSEINESEAESAAGDATPH